MARAHGPSIKDDERYEKLRARGASKEKAARIANAGKAGQRKGAKAPPYEKWTRGQLYDRARQIGIEGRSHMRKQELIEALRSHGPGR